MDKKLWLFLAAMLAAKVLAGLELGVDAGLFFITNRYDGVVNNYHPYHPSHDELDNLKTRAYIGMHARKTVHPKLKLGAKILYNHRDFKERSSDLYSRGRYADIMLHPIVRLGFMEAYGGPSLAVLIASDHSGGFNYYTPEMKEDFAQFIPGLHAGVRLSQPESKLYADLTYNYDITPFSKSFEVDKYQSKLMAGVSYRFYSNEDPVEHLVSSSVNFFDYLPTQWRWRAGFMANNKDLTEFYVANEASKSLGMLKLGLDIKTSFGVISDDDTFGVWNRYLAGPRFGLKLGVVEPYVIAAYGFAFVMASDGEAFGGGVLGTYNVEGGVRFTFLGKGHLDVSVTALGVSSGHLGNTLGLAISFPHK